MYDLRQTLFAIIVAVLLTFFAFTSIDAFYPAQEYPEHCDTFSRLHGYELENLSLQERETRLETERECYDAYTQSMEFHNFVTFVIASLLALVIIITGMYIPNHSTFRVALANGFLLGGLCILFFGTIKGWGGIATQLRPFIILLELVIVIVVARKKMESGRLDTKRQTR